MKNNHLKPTKINRLTILIPVFNSEKSIGELIDKLVNLYVSKFKSLEILVVNDGSKDSSQERLEESFSKHPDQVRVLKLARNFGEHSAVMCGLAHSSGDAVVIMDDDFQNPPEEILPLVTKIEEGYDVVYSFYDKIHQNLFRTIGSWFAGKVANLLLNKPKDLYLSSFKILNSFLVSKVTEYHGPFPYLDGLILKTTNSIGRQKVKHSPRRIGQSNYNIFRLVHLWLNMFTGFSILPLRIASILGLIFSISGFLLSIFFTIVYFSGPVFIKQSIPPGWSSIIVSITLFGGIQLCVLGLLGEYLGRVFITSNRSPQYVVRERIGFPENERR